MMATANLGMFFLVLLSFTMPFAKGLTDQQDVSAINSLYVALGSPPLPGWIPNGGDPCLEAWQGVVCAQSSIVAITINSANLGGQLGDGLGDFTNIVTIDLSNNYIGGSIPENLPLTLHTFFLSANQLTGSIPNSLSKLTLLTDMSVNENHLSGDLPDAFQALTGLINLDLSSNNFSSKLPPSMKSLSSLTTLHVQNNLFSGTLDVLQDLPLKDLNVENNLFSGPVPQRLLSIPNFKKDGNPFNTSISPSPSVMHHSPQPSLPSSKAPSPNSEPSVLSGGPSSQRDPKGKHNSFLTIRLVSYVLVSGVSVIVIVLVVMFCISKYRERRSRQNAYSKRHPVTEHERLKETKYNEPNNAKKKTSVEMPRKQNTGIDTSEAFLLPPPPPPPVVTLDTTRTSRSQNLKIPTSAVSYSVASLQQYTKSFGEENLIKDGILGKVYLAEPREGKLLTVMKLDNANSKITVNEFLELVVSLLELRHPNIVELVGYCAEFGQRLLVYNYFSKMTLHDVLHYEDDLRRKLSWDVRLQITLGAAKALEYLHEFCQPPIVHQNFEPTNILLNDQFHVRVSECGLAPFLSSNSVHQLSGRMRALLSYVAPEFRESGSCTVHSDVYSFGVVMLELITGRKPFDSSRPRAEQHLVRWASSQLHDINSLSKMVDPSISGKCPKKLLSQYADIISRCIQQAPEFRPPMSEVVQDLMRIVDDTSELQNASRAKDMLSSDSK